MRLVPLLLGDVVPIDRGHHPRVFIEARVAFNAEQHERRNDQDEQQPHEKFHVMPEKVEHGRKFLELDLKQKRRTGVFAFV